MSRSEESNIKDQISRALAAEDFSTAEELAKQLINISPDDPEAYWELANVKAGQRDYESAVQIISKSCEIYSDEPKYFFCRAIWNREAHRLNDCLIDCEKVIDLSQALKNNYYLDAILLIKADTLIENGNLDLAKEVCIEIDKDEIFPIGNRLVSKSRILYSIQLREARRSS